MIGGLLGVALTYASGSVVALALLHSYRRAPGPGALALVCLALMGVCPSIWLRAPYTIGGYLRGDAAYVTAANVSLNPDPVTRVAYQPHFGHSSPPASNWLLSLLVGTFGPMRHHYTGPYPTQAEATDLIHGAGLNISAIEAHNNELVAVRALAENAPMRIAWLSRDSLLVVANTSPECPVDGRWARLYWNDRGTTKYFARYRVLRME